MKPSVSKGLYVVIPSFSLESKLEILKEDPNFRLLVEEMYQNYMEKRKSLLCKEVAVKNSIYPKQVCIFYKASNDGEIEEL